MYTDKDYPIPDRWVIGEYSYSRCPKSQVPAEMFEWVRAYKMFQSGRDPMFGGWNDQAAKYSEVMLFIDNELEKHRREHDGRK